MYSCLYILCCNRVVVFRHCFDLFSSFFANWSQFRSQICFQALFRPLQYPVSILKVSKGANIRNRYNQVPHLTQDTNGKVTNSQLDTTNESKEVSPFPAGDHKAHINRRAQRHSKHKTEFGFVFYLMILMSGLFLQLSVDVNCFAIQGSRYPLLIVNLNTM